MHRHAPTCLGWKGREERVALPPPVGRRNRHEQQKKTKQSPIKQTIEKTRGRGLRMPFDVCPLAGLLIATASSGCKVAILTSGLWSILPFDQHPETVSRCESKGKPALSRRRCRTRPPWWCPSHVTEPTSLAGDLILPLASILCASFFDQSHGQSAQV